jgi:hypothetical protein
MKKEKIFGCWIKEESVDAAIKSLEVTLKSLRKSGN